LHTVPGRMELLHEPGKPSVVIDYAHTPQALSQALENARKHVSGKLICVFGCGGDRDRGKRPLMAQGAERLADVLIVTSDNPRNEDPQDIINDIKAGIGDEAHLLIETDRRKAILQAIAMADEKDLVLIAGGRARPVILWRPTSAQTFARQAMMRLQLAAKILNGRYQNEDAEGIAEVFAVGICMWHCRASALMVMIISSRLSNAVRLPPLCIKRAFAHCQQ